MSRIFDAIQRAAEQGDDDASLRPIEAAVSTVDDLADLEREPFPIEMSERRKPRPAAGAAPATAAPTGAGRIASGGSDASEGGTANPAVRSLSFERIDAHYAGKIVADAEISPASREQYRRLAASLHHAQAASGIKVVILTSAVMGEGKTLTSSNLALTLSESYQKQVLLIDADLRRPAVHHIFSVRSASGLSEGLIESSDRRIPVHQVTDRLAVLVAGRPTSDPIAGLTSPRMRRLLDEAREAFDWIIVDTPPVAMLPDANLLSSIVDGAVLVVRAGSTPWELVQRAVAAIGKERTLGVVLNSVARDQGGSGDGGYYGYYYAPSQPEVQSPA